MKKLILFTFVCLITFSSGFAQSKSDTITVKKVFGGYKYVQDNKLLSVKQLMATLEENEEAYKIIKSAKSSYDISMVLGCAGGFCIGYPLGTALGGGEPNWAMAGIGAGLVLIAIPISNQFNKKAFKAVDLYNQGFRKTSFWDDKELNLTFTSTGIGLKYSF